MSKSKNVRESKVGAGEETAKPVEAAAVTLAARTRKYAYHDEGGMAALCRDAATTTLESPPLVLCMTDGMRVMVSHIMTYRPQPANEIRFVLASGHQAVMACVTAQGQAAMLAKLDRMFGVI